jgi:hypothetical protein
MRLQRLPLGDLEGCMEERGELRQVRIFLTPLLRSNLKNVGRLTGG